LPSSEADTFVYTNDSNGVLMRTVPTAQVPGTPTQPVSTVMGWLRGEKGPPLSHLNSQGRVAQPVGCCLESQPAYDHNSVSPNSSSQQRQRVGGPGARRRPLQPLSL
jgi:hypothetical protein